MTSATDFTLTGEPVLAADEMDELPDRLMHKRGCPKSRIETYTATRPRDAQNDISAREITVQRCIDCGNHYVKE